MRNCIIPTTCTPALLALLRTVTGLLFFEHGTSKFLHFPINEEFLGMYSQMGSMLTITGILEFVGGLLIIIGAFTRVTAFILSGFMAIAFWMVHVGSSGIIFPMINHGEPAVLYCFIFLYLAAAGAGPYSVDAMRKVDQK